MTRALALLLLACGVPATHDAGTIRAVTFTPPALCVQRFQCCWVSAYDGVHCTFCCDSP
jgi:hypothetical protein